MAASASAQTVTLNGSMGTRQALLVIDGVPRVVEIGATVQGVRLVSLSGTQAEIDVGGKRRLLVAGAGPVRLGEGAEIRQPMAITVIGGVAISGFFTLLVIPVVYSILDRKRFGKQAGDSAPSLTAPASQEA